MDILKLVQQIKDAEGVTLASVIKKVEDIRVGEDSNRADLKKLANALLSLKKEVDGIPLTSEVKKLQKAISDAESRVQSSLDSEIKAVKTDIRNTESRLRQEIEDRIPDIITVTEKVTEVAKELDDEEQKKVLDKVLDPEFVAKVRDVIENFEGDDRMDASKLKNLPQLQALNAGGGSNLSVFKDGGFVSSSTRLNFVGSGVTVSDEGGRTRVSITGGSGSSTFLDLTDTPSAYTGQAGKVVAVNVGEDGLEFIEVAGTGTVTSVAVSGSDGIEVDSGSPITAAGTIALGINKTNLLTHINVEDGAEVNTIDSVTDTAEIDLTVTARALSASIVAGSIDESKLDASVNASLDLADSASQPGHTHVAADITDFDTAVAANSAVAANTAKVSNATHTGDVTGATALTITDGAVTLAKMANLAQDQFIGRTTASTGVPETATITAAARTVLDDTTVADMVNTLGGAASTGTGGLVRTGSPALITPSIEAITVSGGTLTLPTGASSNLVSRVSTDTLTNKTLTAPVLTGTTDAARLDYDQAVGTVSALGNLGATETFNWAAATHFTGNLDANITIDFTGAVSGQSITIYYTYSGAARTMAYTPTIVWLDNATGAAPTPPAASGNVLVVTYQYIGTTYYASATGNYAVYS